MKEPNIEVNCQLIREKLQYGDVITRFVNSSEQLIDLFTKSLENQGSFFYNYRYQDGICSV